jgi:sugar phosphate isomerase/epimerase
MNKVGISSACFYPEETEISFRKIADMGIKTCEFFINSPREIEDEFIDNILNIKNKYGMDIVSVHPYGSFAESFSLFSNYYRRYLDYISLYRRFFEVTKKLGADIFVVHGIKSPGSIPDEEYFKRFSEMIDIASEYDVIFAQENVVLHRSESPEFLLKMKNAIGEKFKVVLDIKQARRAGYSPYEFIENLGESICHIHISDSNFDDDCLPVGAGDFDFNKFFAACRQMKYNGAYILELYNYSFHSANELLQAKNIVEKMVNDGNN